jgi:mono/diheme cytochrome c family protein
MVALLIDRAGWRSIFSSLTGFSGCRLDRGQKVSRGALRTVGFETVAQTGLRLNGGLPARETAGTSAGHEKAFVRWRLLTEDSCSGAPIPIIAIGATTSAGAEARTDAMLLLRRSLVLAVVLGAAPASIKAQGLPASVDRGQHLAKAYCASCHAIGKEPTDADSGVPAFRNIAKDDPQNNLDEAFGRAILSSHPGMPQFAPTPSNMADLLAYLRSVQAPSPSPGGAR